MKSRLRKIRTLLFNAKGRIGRKAYWIAQFCVYPLFLMMAELLRASLYVFLVYYSGHGRPPVSAFLAVSLLACMMVVLIYANIATTIKRWHDRNRSGWWSSMFLFPALMSAAATLGGAWQAANLLMFGWFVWQSIQCFCLRGTVGDNRYGPDPIASTVSSQSPAEALSPVTPQEGA